MRSLLIDRSASPFNNLTLARSSDVVALLLISTVLLVMAFMMNPIRTGDGQYYLAMLEGLANHFSPAITHEVAQTVFDRTGLDTQAGMVLRGTDGNLYAWHFWAYSLACVPAYWLLKALDLDTLQAFQITNAFLIIWSLRFLVLRSSLGRAVRWLIAGGFILSTATLYFQWTHPEVFTASLLLIASVLAASRQYCSAALLAAIASFQNPSASFLIFPLVLAQLVELRHTGISKDSLRKLAYTACAASLTLVPYVWSLYQFQLLNPIAASGHYIAYSDINLSRLMSFIFDLNQGLTVGMPMLAWSFPLALLARLRRDRGIRLRQEDLLLVAFVIMVLPTLAQANWNAGQSVFLRYAAWAGMPILVWTGITLGRATSKKGWLIAVIPAVCLQIALLGYSGGAYAKKHPSYVKLAPWVLPLWSVNPHLYHPLPEIFRERVLRSDGASQSPVLLRSAQGSILRVLTQQPTLEDAQEEVCGAGRTLIPIDTRPTSQPRLHKTEHDTIYLTGRLTCSTSFPLTVQASLHSGGEIQLLSGWSFPESWGVWSVNETASLKLNVNIPDVPGTVNVTLQGWVFVNDQHPKQMVSFFVNGNLIQQATVNWPETTLEVSTPIPLETLNDTVFGFHFASPTSPYSLGMSSDTRPLAFGLQSIRLDR
ncbi:MULTISPECIES: hypothetical protein [Pseudomonas]|nr:hypothetical protein [Serpens gallinarum]